MATHSSICAWEILWTQEPGRLQVHGIAKSPTGLSTQACELEQHYPTEIQAYNFKFSTIVATVKTKTKKDLMKLILTYLI